MSGDQALVIASLAAAFGVGWFARGAPRPKDREQLPPQSREHVVRSAVMRSDVLQGLDSPDHLESLLEQEVRALGKVARSYCRAIGVTAAEGHRAVEGAAALDDLATDGMALAKIGERICPELNGSWMAAEFERATQTLPRVADELASSNWRDGRAPDAVFDTLEQVFVAMIRPLSVRAQA